MQELKTLLNSLIKMGWKPWGKNAIKMSKQCPDRETGVIYIHFTGEERGYRHIRQLVSQESQLWQFCMEKGLVPKGLTFWQKGKKTLGLLPEILQYDYKYRLLESALVPEEELAKFLVDNIIVEGTMNGVMKSC